MARFESESRRQLNFRANLVTIVAGIFVIALSFWSAEGLLRAFIIIASSVSVLGGVYGAVVAHKHRPT